MANYKSGIITKRDSKTQQIERSEQNVQRVAISQVTLAGAIANNEIIFLAEIPVDARITSIRNWTDDLGTTGTLNLGFYKGTVDTTTAVDTDAVDEDALATAIDVNAAATADVELRFEVQDINTLAKTAWELAGLTSRPDYNTFLVAFTAAAATTAAGDISTVINYVH
jgi:hypothetical protein